MEDFRKDFLLAKEKYYELLDSEIRLELDKIAKKIYPAYIYLDTASKVLIMVDYSLDDNPHLNINFDSEVAVTGANPIPFDKTSSKESFLSQIDTERFDLTYSKSIENNISTELMSIYERFIEWFEVFGQEGRYIYTFNPPMEYKYIENTYMTTENNIHYKYFLEMNLRGSFFYESSFLYANLDKLMGFGFKRKIKSRAEVIRELRTLDIFESLKECDNKSEKIDITSNIKPFIEPMLDNKINMLISLIRNAFKIKPREAAEMYIRSETDHSLKKVILRKFPKDSKAYQLFLNPLPQIELLDEEMWIKINGTKITLTKELNYE